MTNAEPPFFENTPLRRLTYATLDGAIGATVGFATGVLGSAAYAAAWHLMGGEGNLIPEGGILPILASSTIGGAVIRITQGQRYLSRGETYFS